MEQPYLRAGGTERGILVVRLRSMGRGERSRLGGRQFAADGISIDNLDETGEQLLETEATFVRNTWENDPSTGSSASGAHSLTSLPSTESTSTRTSSGPSLRSRRHTASSLSLHGMALPLDQTYDLAIYILRADHEGRLPRVDSSGTEALERELLESNDVALTESQTHDLALYVLDSCDEVYD
ncbi:hypothetical protein EVJ58_g9422 [Rhodofomes roseus]|uniref:Uncharacterized protein n=1 Tax=Rhodofomes roseus TaxID=34475 RepID=A0A4Y9XVR2_9APHY|nr:hypothetical protein EVJ58_g9422 [Rhodofomes roseus]